MANFTKQHTISLVLSVSIWRMSNMVVSTFLFHNMWPNLNQKQSMFIKAPSYESQRKKLKCSSLHIYIQYSTSVKAGFHFPLMNYEGEMCIDHSVYNVYIPYLVEFDQEE